MGNREKLIALAIKYKGEYFDIAKAIKTNEEIEEKDYPNCLTILDDNYPKSLRELKAPPYVLFYKGNIELINSDNIIGVVGSRVACDYALKATKDLVNANYNNVIISGLAKGIDAKAHEEANRTIGVLGCGIDFIYPKENIKLYAKLENEGLIISEYPDSVLPYAYHFPFRNRIIAALAKRIYVMQSSNKSGTVTTINEALELQKEIKVLPYSIYQEEGQYNNRLINDGAMLIDNEDLKIDK